MGDRAWTGIQFSGIITTEVAEGLLAEIEGQCNGTNGVKPVGKDFTMEHLLEPHNQFYDDDCNYASMEGIEAYCQEHHISYFKTWQAGGDYAPGMEIYNAVIDQTFQCADLDGEPVVSLNELVKAHKAGKIEDTIGYLQGFVNFEENYPPIEIRDVAQAA